MGAHVPIRVQWGQESRLIRARASHSQSAAVGWRAFFFFFFGKELTHYYSVKATRYFFCQFMPLSLLSHGTRRMSTQVSLLLILIIFNMNDQNHVLIGRNAGNLVLTLNRPQALNALDLDTIRTLTAALNNASPEDTSLVLLKGNGRAFCAGGDVKGTLLLFLLLEKHSSSIAVTRLGQQRDKSATSFFFEEYRLNHLLATYKKPIVALIDGITMGGGVGLSVHTPFRVCTERSVFAMPETSIGLFPDVGGSFFLPRMDNEALGMFLALTGARLKGQDVFWSGVATHYVPSERLPELEMRLAQLHPSATTHLETIGRVLDELSGAVDYKQYSLAATGFLDMIDTCFSRQSVEAIFRELAKHPHPAAKSILDTLKRMSPTSLKITHRQLQLGKRMDFARCFQMEYRLASRAVQAYHQAGKSRDFYEGVRAVLVDKDNKPRWNPAHLKHVTESDVDWYFSPFTDSVDEWDLPEPTFMAYPAHMGLPFERDIKRLMEKRAAKNTGGGKLTRHEVMAAFRDGSMGAGVSRKPGVMQKVQAVLDRCTSEQQDGALKWTSKLV